MTDPLLLDRAAGCYLRAGLPDEAIRCYRQAGAHWKAADLGYQLGRYAPAAADYAAAGKADIAAWLYAHHADDPAAARAALAPRPDDIAPPLFAHQTDHPDRPDRPDRPSRPTMSGQPGAPGPMLRRRLVYTRCDLAEGSPGDVALPVLAAVARELARTDVLHDQLMEDWAGAVAEVVRRPDQTALIFAAAVRGRRFGAVDRWSRWSRRVLGTELVLPADHRSPVAADAG